MSVDGVAGLNNFGVRCVNISLRVAERVAGDIEQVWLNCATFNVPGSEVARLGEDARAALESAWAAEGLPPLPELAAANAARHVKVKLRLPNTLKTR